MNYILKKPGGTGLCGIDGIRTRIILGASEVPSQLDHDPMCVERRGIEPRFAECKSAVIASILSPHILEHPIGIEPTSLPWQGSVLPLYYRCILLVPPHRVGPVPPTFDRVVKVHKRGLVLVVVEPRFNADGVQHPEECDYRQDVLNSISIHSIYSFYVHFYQL